MKNLIYLSTLLFAVVFIFSCTPCPDCPDTDPTDYDYTAQLKDTISNERYDLWVSNWKNYGMNFQDTMQYFTMPTIDLEEFLQFPGTGRDTVAAARFVLGLEIDGTDTLPHLMLVGVNSAGESMLDSAKQQYIYDVSTPCPTSSGKSSLPK